jgi:hypothetical protein
MYGQLSPEERRAMRTLFWSRPMWGYQAVVFIGLGLLLAANLVLWIELSAPSPPGNAASYAGLYILAILGGAVAVVGLVVRRLALSELAVGVCPKCGQVNLWTSAFCRKCGTRFEDTPGPEPTLASSPPSEASQ